MAYFDYHCTGCDETHSDVSQPIGSDALELCPEGHPWKRLISKVKIAPGFTGLASVSTQMETFFATGDPELAFPKGKPDEDAFTMEDLTDHQIDTNQYG